MPRLFVSQRKQPTAAIAPATAKASLTPVRALSGTTPRALIVPQLNHQQPIAPVPIAMPTPSPPPALATRPPMPPPTDDGQPLVLVPTVPGPLARLMDSHDLDNPYLVAAFNVLIENKNNPMRVPDILNAVQRKGWTQVLHRHKDRPEQLFGNALRSHQRRREMINKPSLVFMIDAGSCWKHHQLDLSAASGRKKGKIWCFSLAAGFPCPYARLGLDLAWVIAAQEGGGGAPKGGDDEDEEDEGGKASKEQPARKKRRLAASSHIAKPSVLLDHPAVRGGVTSAQPVVSHVEPPPYIPAATIQNRAQETAVRAAAIPVEIVPRASRQTRTTSRAAKEMQQPVIVVEEHEVDLEALTAMSPEPEPESMMLIEDDEPFQQMQEPEIEELATVHHAGLEEIAPTEIHAELASALAALASPIVDFLPSTPIVDPHLEGGNASDDDEDDFHVTMNEFAPSSPPHQALLLSTSAEATSPESSNSSMIRTPTPPPQETARNIAMWSLQTAQSSIIDSSAYGVGVFTDDSASFAGLGYDLGGWDNADALVTGIQIKTEPADEQGWSRAGSTFGSYSIDRESVAPHETRSMLDPAEDAASFVMEPMELDTLPLPGNSTFLETASMCSARSREGSMLSVRMGSISSSRRGSTIPMPPPSRPASRMASPRITPLPDLPIPELDLSRRSSLSAASSPHPHPIILYSPSLGPSSVESSPFMKSGLAHRYLVDMHPDDDDEGVEVQDGDVDVDDLLNFDEGPATNIEPSKLTLPATASRPIGIKRPRSPSM